MNYTNILVEQENTFCLITINRENKLNALNRDTLAELNAAFHEAFNSKRIRGILLTGAGNKAFAAGADISEFAGYNHSEGKDLAEKGQFDVFDFIEKGPKPVVAAINGFALGGGLELAMACHFRIASTTARMGLPEVGLGLIPGYGGTQRLVQLAGKGMALEMILTGNMIDAPEAHRIGLVNRLAQPGELIGESKALLAKIASRSPEAISAAIRAVNAGISAQGYRTEISEFSQLFGTPGFNEGTTAFLEKRDPDFT